MTVLLGRFKRGDDWTARPINFTVDDATQDLTAAGWSVAAQLRPTSPDAETVVDCDIDATALESSQIILSLTDTDTAAMSPGMWLGDVQVTGPTIGIRSSETFEIEVVADVTRPSS